MNETFKKKKKPEKGLKVYINKKNKNKKICYVTAKKSQHGLSITLSLSMAHWKYTVRQIWKINTCLK